MAFPAWILDELVDWTLDIGFTNFDGDADGQMEGGTEADSHQLVIQSVATSWSPVHQLRVPFRPTLSTRFLPTF